MAGDALVEGVDQDCGPGHVQRPGQRPRQSHLREERDALRISKPPSRPAGRATSSRRARPRGRRRAAERPPRRPVGAGRAPVADRTSRRHAPRTGRTFRCRSRGEPGVRQGSSWGSHSSTDDNRPRRAPRQGSAAPPPRARASRLRRGRSPWSPATTAIAVPAPPRPRRSRRVRRRGRPASRRSGRRRRPGRDRAAERCRRRRQ